MGASEQWAEIVGPWRAEAEAHGFRFVDRKVELIEGGHRGIDRLQSGATWLDLAGELGVTQGFWSAMLTTWVDAGEARFSLVTVGEAAPPPRPRGLAGWIAARLLAPLMRRLAPPGARPVQLRAPADLREAIEKHMADLLALAAKPVVFSLEERLAQERADAR